MNRILVAAASALLMTGAALAQEPWASSIQTEGSPSNAVTYGLASAPSVATLSMTAHSMTAPATVDQMPVASIGGRQVSAYSNPGLDYTQSVTRGF